MYEVIDSFGVGGGGGEGSEPAAVQVEPLLATVWDGASSRPLLNPGDDESLAQLRDAVDECNVVWIETCIRHLDEARQDWFNGTYDVWDSISTPLVDWSSTSAVLEAVRLGTPNLTPREGEPAEESLLRAIPYVYSRGAFGTIRDVLSEGISASLAEDAPDGSLTAFSTVGFFPRDADTESGGIVYKVLRTTVAVVRRVVITVRLPDLLYTTELDGGRRSSDVAMAPLRVPVRFLPRKAPTARQVAEAIGIHQASTARAVVGQVRDRLTKGEADAKELNDNNRRSRRPRVHRDVVRAAEEADRLAEIAHQIDGQIAQLMRRFDGQAADAPAPAKALTPNEVERRYGLSLAEVRGLYEDCRRSTETVRQALTVYEQTQREQFQFVAGLLASIVLVPTLIVGIFGANVDVPAERNGLSFPALLIFVLGLVLTGSWAFQIARKRDWEPPPGAFAPPAIAAVLIVIAYGVFLITS